MFEYHPEAIQEAWEAFHWYEARSDSAAEEFWTELRRTRNSITLHPTSWMPYLHGTRCLKLNKYPFAIVYVERSEKILGIAVAHLHRRPGYWRDRVVE
jgi:plasmid stabilization system protein ParE